LVFIGLELGRTVGVEFRRSWHGRKTLREFACVDEAEIDRLAVWAARVRLTG
jgi:hypothetical protein